MSSIEQLYKISAQLFEIAKNCEIVDNDQLYNLKERYNLLYSEFCILMNKIVNQSFNVRNKMNNIKYD